MFVAPSQIAGSNARDKESTSSQPGLFFMGKASNGKKGMGKPDIIISVTNSVKDVLIPALLKI